MPEQYQRWMEQALRAAARGRGTVEPNPLVGAVIIDSQGEVVAVGWHERFGGPHAEVIALRQAGDRARNGTLVVTLEPCCHYGKTPPCTEAIISAGIRRVVAALTDPFPHVAGQGFQRLRQAGIEVIVGVGERAASQLNAPYLKRLRQAQPWVHAKWAMTLDGRLAPPQASAHWISNEASRRLVHQLRGRMDAILVGAGTVWLDDPLLTARPPGPRVARRVVVSARGQLPPDCQLLRTAHEVPTLLYVGSEALPLTRTWQQAGVEVVPIAEEHNQDGLIRLPVAAILTDLYQRGCTNILVEGGTGLLSSFWQADAIDEWHVFVAPVLLGGGPSPLYGRSAATMKDALQLAQVTVTPCDDNAYLHGFTPRGPFAPDS
ncbi:MAG: bifunctional diaminohydroxyphosphoribosylaminopyrimidine deaminase/5-amino-6-(5-phosphoribosylamino)uracil reductase RibD [Gemmataceae bacterium]|nr:bifunctional diaminohydroxyphosphoribosylaminopyrimidine deaminase/5-amino-6-(5-phosphoribosylamino)uracil reductase RibD [Gemmataceae bacterium]MCS7271076.1 bifunctional diaminohydroxyphosphoribosylaminopyrimidine deaminase/5-amino-6-(5-phosphoribosylamino)uracil reductase RibD [Gemmataceae bacterium]MDW8243620.1 bifunctional diaminohydroxyphosphoribosylaminopyrimidine deaminase/5-amino-6-(5-phosphoribosylamino)uracil reductase RibD [Thermogemmata sp.]